VLVYSAGNTISQGLTKHLHSLGNFEKIVCADVFPHYGTYQRYFNWKDTLKLDTKTQVSETKIFNRSQLTNAFKDCTHVLYVTHDHYKLTPSKLNLIKVTAEMTRDHSNIEKTVFVTPSEYDHMNEPNEVNTALESEQNAMDIAGHKSTLIRSDLTFGVQSQLIQNTLLSRIAAGSSVYYNDNQTRRNPISVNDLSKMVQNSMASNTHNGKSFFAKGEKDYNLREVMHVLENCSGKKALINSHWTEKIASPTSANLISEMLYSDCYQNCTKVMANTNSFEPNGYNNATELLDEGTKLEAYEMVYQASYLKDLVSAPTPKRGLVENMLY